MKCITTLVQKRKLLILELALINYDLNEYLEKKVNTTNTFDLLDLNYQRDFTIGEILKIDQQIKIITNSEILKHKNNFET